MREIKFRAWDKKLDCLIPNIQNQYCTDINVAYRSFRDILESGNPIMQYTGLKDKNGKEIYEGDILLIQDTWKEVILDDGGGPTEPCNHLSAVGFFSGMFGVYIRETADIYNTDFWSFERLLNEDDGDLEVIGNIYEQSHLLEE